MATYGFLTVLETGQMLGKSLDHKDFKVYKVKPEKLDPQALIQRFQDLKVIQATLVQLALKVSRVFRVRLVKLVLVVR
jgi:hypothetical protein